MGQRFRRQKQTGGADDEVTLNRNTNAFNDCDLVPNVLASVGEPDLSTTLFGRKIDMPLFLSPTAMQSLYTPEGDKASARAAEKFGTMYSMSTMASFSIEEIANISSGPKLFQLYVHKDQSITDDLIDRCRRANFDGLCLTVDTLVAGNRERDHRTGFTTPPKLTVYPIFLDVISSQKISVGPPFYHKLIIPFLIPFLLMMAIGPKLKWIKSDLKDKIYLFSLLVISVLISFFIVKNFNANVLVNTILISAALYLFF